MYEEMTQSQDASVQCLYRVTDRARGKILEVPQGDKEHTLQFPDHAQYVGVCNGASGIVCKWFDVNKTLRKTEAIDAVVADALAECLPVEERPLMLIGGDYPYSWGQ